jgi:hypothetical protein
MPRVKALSDLGHAVDKHFRLHRAGEFVEVTEAEAKRLVDLGVAELAKGRPPKADDDKGDDAA